jgi:MoxR-like ATPase
MDFSDLATVAEENILVPTTFDDSYKGSKAIADIPLGLPSASNRNDAFRRIQETLAVPESTLREVFTEVADGRHILLYGPPGTGKTTLAELLGAEAFGVATHTETASADWTAFETVGGLQLGLEDGKETLRPRPGVITEAIVRCLNAVSEHAADNSKPQAAWLVLDELNRANMDAAFGPLFTSLDQSHRRVSLPFFDEARRVLWVPRSFRIVGTMNTYDKNFLFRMSYALTRRFALVPMEPPTTGEEAADERRAEKEALWTSLHAALSDHGDTRTVADLKAAFSRKLMEPLYDVLVQKVRSPDGLNRGLGFALVASAVRHAALERHLELVDDDGLVEALDRGVRAAIVPQLEGLPNSALKDFTDWWERTDAVSGMSRAIAATKLLIRDTSLFVTS